jgi:hypothetical protein
MGGEGILSMWDTCAFAIPFVAILGFALFGLDERLANPRRNTRNPRAFCGVDRYGQPFLSDPDGNPWKRQRGQIEARLICSAPSRRMDSRLGRSRS